MLQDHLQKDRDIRQALATIRSSFTDKEPFLPRPAGVVERLTAARTIDTLVRAGKFLDAARHAKKLGDRKQSRQLYHRALDDLMRQPRMMPMWLSDSGLAGAWNPSYDHLPDDVYCVLQESGEAYEFIDRFQLEHPFNAAYLADKAGLELTAFDLLTDTDIVVALGYAEMKGRAIQDAASRLTILYHAKGRPDLAVNMAESFDLMNDAAIESYLELDEADIAAERLLSTGDRARAIETYSRSGETALGANLLEFRKALAIVVNGDFATSRAVSHRALTFLHAQGFWSTEAKFACEAADVDESHCSANGHSSSDYADQLRAHALDIYERHNALHSAAPIAMRLREFGRARKHYLAINNQAKASEAYDSLKGQIAELVKTRGLETAYAFATAQLEPAAIPLSFETAIEDAATYAQGVAIAERVGWNDKAKQLHDTRKFRPISKAEAKERRIL